MKTFTSYANDITRVVNNSDSDTALWANEVVMDSIRYLVTKYYFNERTYTVSSQAQIQFYNLPPRIKKLINVTVTIGNLIYQPKECPSREYWDSLNTVTFYQDFPSFFFVYNGQVGIFPIPASSSNTVTLHYKTRIEDLSMADVTGTCTIITNTITVTGSGFKNWMAGQWIRVAHSSTDSTNGDNQWYQIDTVTSGTVLVLKNNYTGATVTSGAFTIGEVSILPEDYQDLPLWRMAVIYYTTRFPDQIKADQYTSLYDKGILALNDEFGSKSTNVVLTDTSGPVYNPNLFARNIG